MQATCELIPFFSTWKCTTTQRTTSWQIWEQSKANIHIYSKLSTRIHMTGLASLKGYSLRGVLKKKDLFSSSTAAVCHEASKHIITERPQNPSLGWFKCARGEIKVFKEAFVKKKILLMFSSEAFHTVSFCCGCDMNISLTFHQLSGWWKVELCVSERSRGRRRFGQVGWHWWGRLQINTNRRVVHFCIGLFSEYSQKKKKAKCRGCHWSVKQR